MHVLLLPPLDSLRFFEAAARHQSFARAAAELHVTASAVAHRVRMLEKHLDVPLFDRRQRGVRLTGRGQAYLKEVQRILAEVHGVSERQRRWPRRVRIVRVARHLDEARDAGVMGPADMGGGTTVRTIGPAAVRARELC